MGTRIIKNSITYFLLAAILMLTFFVCFNMFNGNAKIAEAAGVDDNNTIAVISDDDVASFGDKVIQPKWFTYQPRLGWTKNDNFSNLSFSDKEITYYTGSGVHAFGGYVNEECFSVIGTDVSGEVYRLVPVNGLSEPNNINSNGAVTIRFANLQAPRGTCVFYNDNDKLNSLTSAFHVNSTTKLGTGKILYRSTNGSTFGNWSYTNLTDSKTLNFTEHYVQIAVIYELNEKGR